MGLGLLCGVAFCFLGVGLTDAEVTQTPRYLVKRKGQKVSMECWQDMNHDRMFWYRQDPALGLQLVHLSYGVDSLEKGDFPDGYSVSRKKKEGFSLTLESASTTQTSVYLCASSVATAPHDHILSAQKGGAGGRDPRRAEPGWLRWHVCATCKNAVTTWNQAHGHTLARTVQAVFQAHAPSFPSQGPFPSSPAQPVSCPQPLVTRLPRPGESPHMEETQFYHFY